MQAPGIENFSPNNSGKEEKVERGKQRNTQFSKNMYLCAFIVLLRIALYDGSYKSVAFHDDMY